MHVQNEIFWMSCYWPLKKQQIENSVSLVLTDSLDRLILVANDNLLIYWIFNLLLLQRAKQWGWGSSLWLLCHDTIFYVWWDLSKTNLLRNFCTIPPTSCKNCQTFLDWLVIHMWEGSKYLQGLLLLPPQCPKFQRKFCNFQKLP